MDDFAHLSVLISIVLGLGITNLLMGLARVIQMRDRVKVYWPTLVWAFTLLLVHVQTWWAMFGLRALDTWTFQAFAITLLQPILLFFLSALALPDFDRDEALDLRANYFAQARWFFGILLALVFASLLRSVVVMGRLQDPADLIFHVVFIVASVGSMIVTNETYHKVVAPLGAAVYLFYIALLFTALR
ncbi:MAG TPA: hypothetical protein VIZ30_08000 [Pseudomonadales bacterium]